MARVGFVVYLITSLHTVHLFTSLTGTYSPEKSALECFCFLCVSYYTRYCPYPVFTVLKIACTVHIHKHIC